MGQYYKPTALGTNETVSAYDFDNGLKLMEHSWITNKFVRAVETLISKGGRWYGKPIVWAGDYADNEENENENLYDKAKTYLKPIPTKEKFQYLVNLDTNEFVDLKKIPVSEIYDDFEYCIHPLPILTCEGNGQGSGDFYGSDPDNLVGKWARNRVIIQNEMPENMTELIFNLIE